MSKTNAIETKALTKRFGKVTAIEDLSLEVPAGAVYGFLGPNGAGKSTTIDILLDLTRPTEGTATVLGYDTRISPVSIRKRTGVLLDGFTPYATLTAREHVTLAADAKGVEADDVDPQLILNRVDMRDAIDRTAGGFSKGMIQRLGLAMALVGDPDLLVLDEPSTGLDPHGVSRMRQLIREENERGATVFFSSHILDQVDAVSDYIGILDEGRLVVEDDIATLREATRDAIVRIRTAEPFSEVHGHLDDVAAVSQTTVVGSEFVVRCSDAAATTSVIAALEQSPITIESIEIDGQSLEDVYTMYVGD